MWANSFNGFGLFLNGVNIAFAGGPVNIDNPNMVNTGFPTNGGVDGSAYQTTPLGGLLVVGGNPVVTYGGPVIAGTNTLTFIIADANDTVLDTTAFIEGLGNAPPPTSPVPEPSRIVGLLGMAGLGLIGLAWRRRRAAA